MADVSCVPDDLAEEIACLAEQNRQTLLAEIVFLLCRIAAMDCNPDTLADQSAVRCLSNWNDGMLLASAVKLLCDISNAGGTVCLRCGDDTPPPFDPPCNCSIYFTNSMPVDIYTSNNGATWNHPLGNGPDA